MRELTIEEMKLAAGGIGTSKTGSPATGRTSQSPGGGMMTDSRNRASAHRGHTVGDNPNRGGLGGMFSGYPSGGRDPGGSPFGGGRSGEGSSGGRGGGRGR